MSTDIQLALEKRLVDLKQLLKRNPALSSAEVENVEAYNVRWSIISFPTSRSQLPFQSALPDHPPFTTIREPLSLNNLIDNI